MNTVVIKGRLSYPSLLKAKANNLNLTAPPKFSTQLLFEVGQDLSSLAALLVAAAEDKWGSDRKKWKGYQIWPGRTKASFKHQAIKAQADKLLQADGTPRQGFVEGAFYIEPSCAADRPPGIVDKKNQLVIDEAKVYGGVYANVEVNAYAYDNVTAGLNFGLLNVQILGYGDPFGFVRNAPEKVFKPVEDEDGGGEPGGASSGQTADDMM